MTENQIVERIRRLWAGGALARGAVGIGDDAAVLPAGGAPLLISTDLFIEGTHFERRFAPAPFIGRKALAVAASDIAAMGGVANACLLSLGVPQERAGVRVAEAVLAAFHEEAREIGIPLVGGDLSRCRGGLLLDVVVLGRPAGRRPVLRSGARPGDGLYVTGPLGGSAAGLALLRRGRHLWKMMDLRDGRNRSTTHHRILARQHRVALETLAVLAHLRPRPPLAAGAAFGRSGLVHAMMDLSDGLAADLPRLCTASGVGARVHERLLPLHEAARAVLGPARARAAALGGGEDYELLLSAPESAEPRLRDLAVQTGSGLVRIGEVTGTRGGIQLVGQRGSRPLPETGWDPFRRPARRRPAR